MTRKAKFPFDPRAFLAKADGGRAIATYKEGQAIFSQGDTADAIFYITRRQGESHRRFGARQGSHRGITWAG